MARGVTCVHLHVIESLKLRRSLTLLGAVLLGCGNERVDPAPPPGEAALTVLTDLDPALNVVHVVIVAREAEVELRPGVTTSVWAYADGAIAGATAQVPGPLLVAQPGDQVIVDFRNDLPKAATTIHWHGIRLASDMDGAGNHHGDEVFPGQTFQYRFVARDAGTFWYHPHVRADEQVERGLYGPIVVRAGDAPRHTERVLVLDDVDLAESGELAIEPTEEDVMMGRHGDLVIVNGRPQPQFVGVAGDTERWRIVNAANGRYFEISAAGRALRVVEADGGALLEPIDTERLRVTPGERFTVDVEVGGQPGEVLSVTTSPVDAGHGPPDAGERVLFSVRLEEGITRRPARIEPVAFERLVSPGAAVTRLLVLRDTLDESLGRGFSINDEAWPFNTPLDGVTGTSEVWRIENATEGAHPFHLHGMFFQVLDASGERRDELGWKDTVDIPPDSTLDLAVRLERGAWMFHCQILEHAERGMMGEIRVAP